MIWKWLDALLYRRWHRQQIRHQEDHMITVTDQTPIMTPTVLVLEGTYSDSAVDGRPERDYDFNRGDERRFDREEAIAVARLRVKDRGCRQLVRQTQRPAGDDHLIPRWLVQDI